MKLYQIIDNTKTYDLENLDNVEIIGEITGGRNLTLGEVIELLGGSYIWDPDESHPGDPDILINGIECWGDCLIYAD